MRGPDWVRCCICGTLHRAPYDGLHHDVNDKTWDVCEGDCAIEAGLLGPAAKEVTDGDDHRHAP